MEDGALPPPTPAQFQEIGIRNPGRVYWEDCEDKEINPIPFGSLSDEARRSYEIVSALELDTYRKFRQSGGTHADWCLLSLDEKFDLCSGDADEAYANLQALDPGWMPWRELPIKLEPPIKREREGAVSVVLHAVPAQAFASVHPMSLPFITITSFCISVAFDTLGNLQWLLYASAIEYRSKT